MEPSTAAGAARVSGEAGFSLAGAATHSGEGMGSSIRTRLTFRTKKIVHIPAVFPRLGPVV